jgi:hypothetical protein
METFVRINEIRERKQLEKCLFVLRAVIVFHPVCYCYCCYVGLYWGIKKDQTNERKTKCQKGGEF